MMLPALERLRLFLRPPGRGIYTVSTGGGYAVPLLRGIYGSEEPTVVQRAWEDSLQKVRRATTLVLGIPSDTGAGILRGANFGPLGIRLAYLKKFGLFGKDILDVGDVIVVPQLLHDEMLNDAQIQATREVLYAGQKEALPVSPLSIGEAVLGALYELNPKARIVLLGGDHSVSWPAMKYCHKRCERDFAVLHFDAHTDLLETRVGVKYCFATWARQAMSLMKPGHMVQVGIRTSGKPKEYWEQLIPVKQFWANEIRGQETEAMERILAYFHSLGTKQIYISNDIDGTDSEAAPATGTPEDAGLTPEFVKELCARVKKEFTLVGGDVVEVAPPLSGNWDFANEKTCVLAAEYLHSLLP